MGHYAFPAACLVLASTCNGSKNYISHCRYVGHQCSTGDVNSTGLRGFLTGNVSCGNSSSSATEYCTLANPNEEDLDRFQCFSLYEFNKVTKRRVLVVAGCIFNHPLSICTANTCNFSHEVDLDADHGRPNSTLHYCCCNTKNDCNRNGIVGYPSSTPTTSTAVATGMTPRTGELHFLFTASPCHGTLKCLEREWLSGV